MLNNVFKYRVIDICSSCPCIEIIHGERQLFGFAAKIEELISKT